MTDPVPLQNPGSTGEIKRIRATVSIVLNSQKVTFAALPGNETGILTEQ